jgi:hypothetical protein
MNIMLLYSNVGVAVMKPARWEHHRCHLMSDPGISYGNKSSKPVTVAVWSEAWVLAGWLLGSWVRIPLKVWMFVRVFLCCVVLRR